MLPHSYLCLMLLRLNQTILISLGSVFIVAQFSLSLFRTENPNQRVYKSWLTPASQTTDEPLGALGGGEGQVLPFIPAALGDQRAEWARRGEQQVQRQEPQPGVQVQKVLPIYNLKKNYLCSLQLCCCIKVRLHANKKKCMHADSNKKTAKGAPGWLSLQNVQFLVWDCEFKPHMGRRAYVHTSYK